MDFEALKRDLWEQFGASIDMLDDALTACPDALWTAVMWDDPQDPRFGELWFVAYHVVRWLDVYLTGTKSPEVALAEPFVRGRLPDETYPKAAVHDYLRQARRKCRSVIEALTVEKAAEVHRFEWNEDITFLSLLMYNMRHVQEHTSQINYVLGRNGLDHTVGDWVSKARESV